MRIACCHLVKSSGTSAGAVYTTWADCRANVDFRLEFLESISGCGKEGIAEAASAYSAIFGSVIVSDEEWHTNVARRILKSISRGGLLERERGFVHVMSLNVLASFLSIAT